MSRTAAIELSAIAPPEVAATRASSFRRPSTIGSTLSNVASHDEASLANLERVATITSKGRTAAVITSVTLITGISTLLNGLTTVALPTMARDLDIKDNVLLWYSNPMMP